MPNQKKTKATPKSTPSKATTTPKASPKTRGKAATPKASPQRESRSSTPSKVETPKVTPKKTTPVKSSPKAGKPAAKVSPKGKASPKSNKNTPKGKASPKSRQVESESSQSEDETHDFKVGSVIDAQWEDGLFYSAKVIKVNKTKAGNTYNVEFTQDLVQRKNLKPNQIQSYTDDDSDEGDVSPKHKASNDDQEYVEGQDIPLRYGDESVESDSTEAPRSKKSGRKPANKRKRETPVQAPSAEKKRRLADSLVGLSEKQLVSIVKKACSSNLQLLEAVQDQIPEPSPKKAAAKPKVAPKAVEKKAPNKNAAKNTAPAKKGKNAASTKKAAPQKKGTRSNK